MGETVRNGLSILAGVLLIFTAIKSLPFWVRTRFWLPKYVHVFAGVGGGIMLWCVVTMADDAPLSKHGLLAKLLFVLILPAIIYVIFLLYGGQQAAYARHFKTSESCPSCRLPVPPHSNNSSAGDQKLADTGGHCSHCGQSLASNNFRPDR